MPITYLRTNHRSRFICVLFFLTALLALQVAPGFAQCAWEDDFVIPGGLDGTVNDMAVWDDGTGSALYVAGEFFNAGAVAANRIAKWDGTSWSALGTGLSATVNALQVWNGDLYAGGDFTAAGGNAANYLARWDGAAWSAVGQGLNNHVEALTVWDDKLVVAGKFITADGGSVGVKRITTWDGSDWGKLVGPAGNGLNNWVLSLGVWNGELYAGGKFSTAGGIGAQRIARWDGTQWSNLPDPSNPGFDGVTADVVTINNWNDGTGDALYVGGWFARVGVPGENPGLGLLVRAIAKYDGTDWDRLYGPNDVGTPVHTEVFDIEIWNDGTGAALYAGGNFDFAGGTFVNRVGKWDGSNWSGLFGPSDFGIDVGWVYALQVWNDGSGPALYAAGNFNGIAGGTHTASYIAKFACANTDSTAPTNPNLVFSSSHNAGVPNATRVIDFQWSGATDADSGVGGYSFVFDQSPTTMPDSVVDIFHNADPHTWSTDTLEEGSYYFHILACDNAGNCAATAEHRGPFIIDVPGPDAPTNIASPTHDLPSADPEIDVTWDAAAGATSYHYEFSTSATPPDCSAMASTTAGTSATSAPLADGDYYFHVCGDDGSNLGEVATGGPYTVDSALNCSWQTDFVTPGGLDGTVRSSIVWDDGGGTALFLAGDFTTAGGLTVNGVAKWDGTSWSALTGSSGTGVNGSARSLEVWNGDLYVGGFFTTAGGLSARRVARWDGSEWHALSDGLDNDVYALEVWDDGGGEDLYVGGRFITADGVGAKRIARWDGSAWSMLTGPAGNGMNNIVLTLEAWDDMLYAGGKFTTSGGVDTQFISRWDGSAWSNLPDPMNPGFNGVTLDVQDMLVWDDGSGPALFVGGWFARVGVPGENPGDGLLVRSVVKYDGTDWHRLYGPSDVGTPVHTEVYSFAIWNDGTGDSLYMGGNFLAAGGEFVSRVARWDGTRFHGLYGPSAVGVDNNYVYTLSVWNDGSGPALYAAGSFTSAGGGVPSTRIAKFACSTTDSTAPTNPSSLASTSHTVSVPSADTIIDMQWSGAADADSGVAGYSVLFDNSPATTPDALVDLSHSADPHAISSPSLDEGMWYFHLRTCDNAGNCSAAIHAGPYEIAFPGPDAPTPITSSSHDPGPTNNSVIDVAWGPAAGATSYHYLFTNSATPETCATIETNGATTAGTSASSASLADGTWYVQVCGDDGANLGQVSVGGPYVIDSALRCSWQTDFAAAGGPSATARTSIVWDDGGGSALFVGGDFGFAGGVSVNRLAKWDGATWSGLTGSSGTGLNGPVYALAVYEGDLYVGGAFTTAGGVSANRIARWDGSEWHAVGSGMNNSVHALEVYDGELYAGGRFITAGGTQANRIAKWDGSSWSALIGPSDNGVDLFVWSLQVWNGDLYVGGKFDRAGGIDAHYIARWDGTRFHNLPDLDNPGFDGVTLDVLTMEVFDDGGGSALYLGGWFARVGVPGENPGDGLLVRGIVKYDGTDWTRLYGPSDVGVPVHSEVWALDVWNDGTGAALYAGGNFLAAGGVFSSRAAAWDGTEWSSLFGPSAVGVNTGYIYSLSVWNDGSGPALYAVGTFGFAGGTVASPNIAKFACANSDAVAPANPTVNSTSHTPNVSSATTVIDMEWSGASDAGTGVAGYSVLFDDQPTTVPDQVVDVLHTADPHTYSSDALEDGTYYFHLLTCDNAGNCSGAVHSGPYVISVPGPDAPGAIVSPSHDAGPTNNPVIDINWGASAGATVYHYDFSASSTATCADLASGGTTVGTTTGASASLADGMYYAHVCAQDGSGFRSEVTTGGPYEINSALRCSWRTDFQSAGGVTGGLATVYDSIVWDDGGGDALYVAGAFVDAGGTNVERIAKWDGTTWSALTGSSGTGINGVGYALEVWDDGGGEQLYVGGAFTTAGGVAARYLAKWDGSEWSAVGTGTNREVRALQVWDDGGGDDLYVGGKFTTAGGNAALRIARWDGTTFTSLNGPSGNGVDNFVWSLGVWNGDLYAGGKFDRAGGIDAHFIARYDGTGWSNLPDPMNPGFDGVTLDVLSIETFDDGGGEALYLGGWFARVGVPGENPGDGLLVRGIVKYDGTDFHRLYGPSDVGVPVHTEVWSMTKWDDGDGEALYIGGNFLAAGGEFVSRVAKWDGTAFTALFGPGTVGVDNNYVYTLSVFDDGGGTGPSLFAGGSFTSAGGGVASPGAAKFGCDP